MASNGTDEQHSGYVDPNWPNPNGPNDVPVIIYGYTPSSALAIFAVILFALSLFAHTYQAARYRSWYFVTLPIALLTEIVGYVARTLAAKQDPYNLIYFIIQYFFIVCAPVLISAAIYAVLSVMINRIGRQYSPIHPKLLLGIFITCDCIATGVQVAGAALIGTAYSNDKDPSPANHILLGGLVFQVVTFLIFIILMSVFVNKAKTAILINSQTKGFLIAFFAATLLVYLRTCFRLAETAQGLEKNLATHEVYFACLEFAPIAAAVLNFNVWHPGRCLGTKPMNSVHRV